MTVKNTLLGGNDWATPSDRIKPTDLNDTFNVVAGQDNLASLFVDVAQNIFNQTYIGFDSRLAGGLGAQYKNIIYSVFTSDDAISKTGFVYDSTEDKYNSSAIGDELIVGKNTDIGENIVKIIPVINGVGNYDLSFSNDGTTYESCENGKVHKPSTTGQKALLKIKVSSSSPYLIEGNLGGTFSGWSLSNSGWSSNSEIISGLTDVGYESSPTIFTYDGDMYLISGEGDDVLNAWKWSGTAWVSDTSIVSGLTAHASRPAFLTILSADITEGAIKYNY